MHRRAFLKVGLTGAAAFSMSGLTRAYQLPTGNATNATLIAESTTRTMIDSTPLFGWQFRDPVRSGPGALTSGLLVQDGDTLKITVDNRLNELAPFRWTG